jgi:hypothetical protein
VRGPIADRANVTVMSAGEARDQRHAGIIAAAVRRHNHTARTLS